MSEREVFFRGKRVDNGEWAYGDLLHCDDEAEIYSESVGKNGGYVIPETVGQYTGLTDKSGTRIFEGDIVKVLNAFNAEVVFKKGAFGVYSSYVDYDYLDSEIAEITGCNNPSRFCRCDNFVSLWELMWNYNQEDDCCSVVEIIGNIHDNGYPF